MSQYKGFAHYSEPIVPGGSSNECHMLSQISFSKQKSSGVTFGMICDAPARQVFRDVPPTGKFLL